MNIVEIEVGKLNPYENNPRINDAAVDCVAASIREFGFKVPLVIDKNHTIVTGHTRWKAAKLLGYKKVPCIIADDLTEEQIRAFRLVDNKTSEQSEWDYGLLDLEMLNLSDFDLGEFGFDVYDEQEEEEKKEPKKTTLKSMELKTFEHHDYVVFVFDNQFDFMKVCSEFKIGKVNAGYGDTKKVGVGRVVKGSELIERLGYKDSDIEQGQEQFDSEEHS